MEISYALSSEFLKGLLSLVHSDSAYGSRVLMSMDPQLLPEKRHSEVFSVMKTSLADIGQVPNPLLIRQGLLEKHNSGSLSDEDYRKTLKFLSQSFRVSPLTRKEARGTLKNAILESELGYALDDVYSLYAGHEYDEIESRVGVAFEKARLLESGSIGFSLSRNLDEYVEAVREGAARVVRIPVGIPELDALLKGGLGRGELGCIIAAQKAGKSMGLVWIAQTAVILGLKVLYITLELSEEEVKNRIAAGILSQFTWDIEEGGYRMASTVREGLSRVLERGGDYVIKGYPSKGASVSDIKAYAEDLSRLWGYRPDVLIVDYADEVAPPSGVKRYDSSGNYFVAGEIYSDLRSLGAASDASYNKGGGMNCAVWTASQVQRQAIDREILTMSDVAESIQKASKVDLMVAVCQNEDERETDMLRLYIAACRYAPGGGGTEQEVGPFVRDFAKGRLVKLDGGRFRGESTWQLRKRILAPWRRPQGLPKVQSQSVRQRPLPRRNLLRTIVSQWWEAEKLRPIQFQLSQEVLVNPK